ncbi:MAG: Glutamine-dependent NAD(+) synthetase [Chlamydiae bacterium]|nr:Glutamine-dependent NAD(+) synthetase [Chlamydiota bacterium]
MTRFFIAQNNYIVGDFQLNAQKIIDSIGEAKQKNCSLIVTSELALLGYPPKDLLYYSSLLEESQQALELILPKTKGVTLLLGCVRKNVDKGNSLYNSCAIIQDGKLIDYYDKWLLPTYDVFNETRYFSPGKEVKVIDHDGQKIALTICEDLWHDQLDGLYEKNPLSEIASHQPDVLVNLSASPFELHKLYKRINLCKEISRKLNCPILFCNQVGGNDSLIFDGYSFVCDSKNLLSFAKGFDEDSIVYDSEEAQTQPIASYLNPQQIYNALVLGLRDYFHKQNFSKALVGLSGGIDSALVATLAARAIGPENVRVISMPSRYSSKHSVEDAKKLAESLSVELLEIPIETVHQSYLDLLEGPFKGLEENVTEENIQSRIRGMILMACSNKWGHLVISCGNKSEMAMGYATLYGDLTGGLAAISDLTKTQVYEVSKWINFDREIIPKSIIEKPPSAELKPNQKDSDSLPDYEILDQIIIDYVEEHIEPEAIAQKNKLDLELVKSVVKKIHLSEYKRRQAPIGLKVTQKAFSNGWQLPIVHSHHQDKNP